MTDLEMIAAANANRPVTRAVRASAGINFGPVIVGAVVFGLLFAAILAGGRKESPAEDPNSPYTKGFSAWDGSHVELVNHVRDSLHDARSFEHVKTTFWDYGTHIIVKMQFRARNGFGAMRLAHVRAELSGKGKLRTWEFESLGY